MSFNQRIGTLISITVGIALFVMLGFMYFNIGAGVIGNIGSYKIDTNKEDVLGFIEQTNSRNSSWLCEEYGYNIQGTGYEDDFIFLRAESDRDEYIFVMNIRNPKQSSIECYLISAARYCSVLKNAREMNMFERYRYRNLFQNAFLDSCPWSWTASSSAQSCLFPLAQMCAGSDFSPPQVER